jgi:hypothetical protein
MDMFDSMVTLELGSERSRTWKKTSSTTKTHSDGAW